MALLQVLKGMTPGQQFTLDGDRAILGRHPDCDIVLDVGAVSRQHAQILQIDADFYVEDLKSRNGTFVNGEQIRDRHRLEDNDRIKICDLLFTFHRGKPACPTRRHRSGPGRSGGRRRGYNRLDRDVQARRGEGARVAAILGQCRSQAQGADRNQQQPGHGHLGRPGFAQGARQLVPGVPASRPRLHRAARARERAAGAQGREAPSPRRRGDDPHQPHDRQPGDAGERSDPLGRRGQRRAL